MYIHFYQIKPSSIGGGKSIRFEPAAFLSRSNLKICQKLSTTYLFMLPYIHRYTISGQKCMLVSISFLRHSSAILGLHTCVVCHHEIIWSKSLLCSLYTKSHTHYVSTKGQSLGLLAVGQYCSTPGIIFGD